jgi:hypothetical protein
MCALVPQLARLEKFTTRPFEPKVSLPSESLDLYCAAMSKPPVRSEGWDEGRQTRSDAPNVQNWVRGFLWLDAAIQRAVNLQDSLRDELFLAWVPPDKRTALTTMLYSREGSYLPGRGHVERGFFPAEEYAFRARPLKPGSRILLGAAGTGRELVTLVERGFDVVAFDPCATFADAARSVAPRNKFIDAAYADVVAAAENKSGPLAFLNDEAPIDGIMFGWGSLSHVLPHIERVRLFRALRKIAPRAPIYASFLYRPETTDFTRGRARNALKRFFTMLGAPSTSEKGDHFSPYIGFFSALGRTEIDELAAESNYDVIHFDAGADAYAVFEPQPEKK